MATIFEEIREQLDLEFFFESESLPYKKSRGTSGEQINAKHCPSCGDSRWRTYLNADSGLGNCFVCNEPFDKIKFIREHFGFGEKDWKSVIDRCKELMKEQGWRPKRTVTAAVEHGEVRLPYSQDLPTADGENLLYLKQRGISDELTQYFRLRWCEHGFWLFDKEGKKETQRFNDRIIIPVYDLDGTLVTFQGRDLTGTSERKYLFPIGLPGTGRFLFNGQNVQATKEIAMGEGAFDVMAMKNAFDEDVTMRHIVAVGSFGKHLSYGATDGNDQLGRFIKIKNAGITTVTIMWDGETKALVSALDAAKILSGIGLTVRIATLPAGRDPNEVLPEVVREAYWKATVWTSKLDLLWRLKNPYRRAA